jgi:hypothetical protein
VTRFRTVSGAEYEVDGDTVTRTREGRSSAYDHPVGVPREAANRTEVKLGAPVYFFWATPGGGYMTKTSRVAEIVA